MAIQFGSRRLGDLPHDLFAPPRLRLSFLPLLAVPLCLCVSLFLLCSTVTTRAAERPNVLWLIG